MNFLGLFRGFFRRDPLFDGIFHEDDDDEDEDDDGGSQHDDFRRSSRDPFDDAFRFGFSFGPDGTRFEEPRVFGRILKDMEEMFAGVPSIEAPPPPEGAEKGRGGGGSRNSLRDFMLKSPEISPIPHRSETPEHSGSSSPQGPSETFPLWRPFSKFPDLWRDGALRPNKEKKEDGDLDSQVSSGGLDHILTPEPSQPKTRSFFKSVSVSKVVRPDGTVEERRTVRDSDGNEETTVSVSGGPAAEDQTDPGVSGGLRPSSEMQDEFSLFSKFFGGFRAHK